VTARAIGAEEPPPPPPLDGDGDATGADGELTPATSMAIEDGTLGRPEPSSAPARLRVRERQVDPELARVQAIEAASTAGVLSMITSPLAVAAGGSIASGFDDLDLTGGFIDAGGAGAPAGSFGHGRSGAGLGCGGVDGRPCEGIRAGSYASIGPAGRPGYDGPFGNGPGGGPGPRRWNPKGPTVSLSPPVACTADDPCIDKELIRRYMKRNLAKISYCYEKELLARPALEGTVTVNFLLSANGAVTESRATGVDAAVSSCIAGVVGAIKFPRVGDTGVFPIRYPFQLRPTGR
jgi:hypothetical protein